MRQVLLALVGVLTATGCVYDPLDGATVDSRYQAIWVAGVSDVPDQRVRIYARDRTDDDKWQFVGETRTDTVSATPDPAGYVFGKSVRLANHHWEDSNACTKTLGAAELKVMVGNVQGFTFNDAGEDCGRDVYNDTGDWINAMATCSTGHTIKLYTVGCD